MDDRFAEPRTGDEATGEDEPPGIKKPIIEQRHSKINSVDCSGKMNWNGTNDMCGIEKMDK